MGKVDTPRKTMLVANGHRNQNVPKRINYCSVVLSESVRIYFTVAVLNEMNIVSGYIGNVYVNTKPLKRCHVTTKDVFMFCQKKC